MKIKFSPAIFLIILLILIYYILYSSNDNNLFIEKFNILKIFTNNIDYSKENRNQYITKILLTSLKQSSSKKKIILKSPCIINKFIEGTTNEYLKDDLKILTEVVVKRLNKSGKFNFIQTSYGNIYILKDKNNIYNYIYDMFLEDVKNMIMLHTKVNLIVFPNKQCIKKNKLYNVFGDIFPVYNIGIPSISQQIPLPTEVIPTAGDILGMDSIRKPTTLKPKFIYINTIEVLNSSLVVNPNKKCLGVNVNGIKDKILDHTNVVKEHTPYIEKSKIRNKWISLNSQPKDREQWPCTEYSWEWNENGIYTPIVIPSKACPGKRWSLTKMPLQPNYNPTLATIPRNDGENAWLFEMSRGIPSFPTGKSV
jgi:hypothetical protein